MKTFTKTLAIAAVIATFSAPSFATIQEVIRSVAPFNGHINVHVSNNTVTLTGFVEDHYARQLAEQTAKKEGYFVNNYLIVNN